MLKIKPVAYILREGLMWRSVLCYIHSFLFQEDLHMILGGKRHFCRLAILEYRGSLAKESFRVTALGVYTSRAAQQHLVGARLARI
jgi:hypothetical protein